MELIQIDTSFTKVKNEPSIVALGFFDGLHLGHRLLIEQTIKFAQKEQCAPCVFTFLDDQSIKGDSKRIYSFNQKIKLLDTLGIKKVYYSSLGDICTLSPKEFVHQILIEICNCKVAICGENFKFGCNASGSAQTLKDEFVKYNRVVNVVPSYYFDGQTLSSKLIRDELSLGYIQKANQMLGSPYFKEDIVQHGKEIGRTISFPTINQSFFYNQQIPKYGVYATFVEYEGQFYPSVTNIGVRPTVGGENVTCETHLIGYLGKDLYGKMLKVQFLEYIREEIHFLNLDELKEQIRKDIKESQKICQNYAIGQK